MDATGSDLNGPSASSGFGKALDLSKDGNTLVVGAQQYGKGSGLQMDQWKLVRQ